MRWAKPRAFFEIARPVNGVIAFASVLMGAFLAKPDTGWIVPATLVALAAFLILSAGNAINDFHDIEIDRINRPTRPIPSGRLTGKEALVFSLICSVLGILLSFLVNVYAIIISVVVVGVLILYAVKLKGTPLLGNLTVGALTGLTFVSGAVAVEKPSGAMMPGVFAFLFTVAREITKDIEDIEGDALAGAKTMPVRWGIPASRIVACTFMIFIIPVSAIPYLMGAFSWRYMLVVAIGVDLPMMIAAVALARDHRHAGRIQRLMKWMIVFGLIGIYLS